MIQSLFYSYFCKLKQPTSYTSSSITQSNRAHDLHQVKIAIQAHTKRSQEAYTSIKNTHNNQTQATHHESKAAGKLNSYFFKFFYFEL